MNVNASRLLFEGLEDRILLSGIPASVLGSAPPVTETYSDSRTDTVGSLDTVNFTLPKFDDHGGLRTLVSVTLDSTTTTTTGTYNVLNVDAFDGIVDMSLDLTAVSTVSEAPSFDYTNIVGASTNQPISVGETVSVTLPQYTSGLQHWVVPAGDFGNFTAAPGDSTILFEITTSSAADHTANVAVNYWQAPLIDFTMTGQVIYEYVTTTTTTDETFQGTRLDFERTPPPMFQPFYSGTAQPGASLTVDVLGSGGELLGSTSTIADAGGNWTASFYDLRMTDQPHTVSIRQSYTGYTPLTGAGYNLRRYFSPAVLGGAYASEQLTVENVLGNRSSSVSMAALYSASAHPTSMGMAPYGFEMLPVSASPQGLY